MFLDEKVNDLIWNPDHEGEAKTVRLLYTQTLVVSFLVLLFARAYPNIVMVSLTSGLFMAANYLISAFYYDEEEGFGASDGWLDYGMSWVINELMETFFGDEWHYTGLIAIGSFLYLIQVFVGAFTANMIEIIKGFIAQKETRKDKSKGDWKLIIIV